MIEINGECNYELFLKYHLYIDACLCYKKMQMNHNSMDRSCVFDGCVMLAATVDYPNHFKTAQIKYLECKKGSDIIYWIDDVINIEQYASEYAQKYVKLFAEKVKQTKEAIEYENGFILQ